MENYSYAINSELCGKDLEMYKKFSSILSLNISSRYSYGIKLNCSINKKVSSWFPINTSFACFSPLTFRNLGEYCDLIKAKYIHVKFTKNTLYSNAKKVLTEWKKIKTIPSELIISEGVNNNNWIFKLHKYSNPLLYFYLSNIRFLWDSHEVGVVYRELRKHEYSILDSFAFAVTYYGYCGGHHYTPHEFNSQKMKKVITKLINNGIVNKPQQFNDGWGLMTILEHYAKGR